MIAEQVSDGRIPRQTQADQQKWFQTFISPDSWEIRVVPGREGTQIMPSTVPIGTAKGY